MSKISTSRAPSGIPVEFEQRAATDPVFAEVLGALKMAHAENLGFRRSLVTVREWAEALPKALRNELFAMIGRE